MTAPDHPTSRLVAVDALRGIAAMAVVLFHYTTRFSELYGGQGSPSVSFPHGHYGVNLFFVISGFVIFMTLERTKRPMDFVVSRFSRLFPAYWVAIALTFSVVSVTGLPGKEVTALQALGNSMMVHGFFGIPHVDGVYWTLEVELLFYAWMLLLFVSGHLHRVHFALWFLLGLRLLYHVMAVAFGINLSWTVSHVLIISYIPWFALGICIYQTAQRGMVERPVAITAVVSVLALTIVDGWRIAALAPLFATLVWLAATRRAPWLENRLLAFFGAISYPLYLIHENIGWVVQRGAQQSGWSFDSSIGAALAVTVSLAALVTWSVERPALQAIRSWHAARSADRRLSAL